MKILITLCALTLASSPVLAASKEYTKKEQAVQSDLRTARDRLVDLSNSNVLKDNKKVDEVGSDLNKARDTVVHGRADLKGKGTKPSPKF